jgi:hypothetical protein
MGASYVVGLEATGVASPLVIQAGSVALRPRPAIVAGTCFGRARQPGRASRRVQVSGASMLGRQAAAWAILPRHNHRHTNRKGEGEGVARRKLLTWSRPPGPCDHNESKGSAS